MIRIIYILLFFFGFVLSAFSQNMQKQKEYADSLFISEKYFDAITEYKRLLFFAESDEYNYEAYYKIALSYKAGGKYDEAIKYFSLTKLNAANVDDSIKCDLQIIRTNILRRTIPKVLTLLSDLKNRYPNSIDSVTIHYWNGWAYMFGNDWESAAEEFEKINKLHPLKSLSDSVDALQYSVVFAKVSSFILPGIGQFYTGNYLSGFLSFGWNTLWGYMTIHAFMTDRAVEGILMGSLLWARFYKGNFQNAEKLAIQKNIEISNRAYKFLAKEYKGEKP